MEGKYLYLNDRKCITGFVDIEIINGESGVEFSDALVKRIGDSVPFLKLKESLGDFVLAWKPEERFFIKNIIADFVNTNENGTIAAFILAVWESKNQEIKKESLDEIVTSYAGPAIDKFVQLMNS